MCLLRGITAQLPSELLSFRGHLFVLEGHKSPVKRRRMNWGHCTHHRDEKTSFSKNQTPVWNSTLWAVIPLTGFGPWPITSSTALGGSFLLSWPRVPRLSNETYRAGLP